MALEPATPSPAEAATPPESKALAPVAPSQPPTITTQAEMLSPSEITALRKMMSKSHKRKFWDAAKSLSLLVSMIINAVLIIIVAVLIQQVGAIKHTLGSVLGQLDAAFQGLGETVIQTTIPISQSVPVVFDLPLKQDTYVTTNSAVPINTQATFSLGQFGSINGTVSLNLPTGTQLPVHLELTVPVSNVLPVVFNQSVAIPLAPSGMQPVVDKLRSALGPILNLVGQLPDRFSITP